jgi:hypothetical protein
MMKSFLRLHFSLFRFCFCCTGKGEGEIKARFPFADECVPSLLTITPMGIKISYVRTLGDQN